MNSRLKPETTTLTDSSAGFQSNTGLRPAQPTSGDPATRLAYCPTGPMLRVRPVTREDSPKVPSRSLVGGLRRIATRVLPTFDGLSPGPKRRYNAVENRRLAAVNSQQEKQV